MLILSDSEYNRKYNKKNMYDPYNYSCDSYRLEKDKSLVLANFIFVSRYDETTEKFNIYADSNATYHKLSRFFSNDTVLKRIDLYSVKPDSDINEVKKQIRMLILTQVEYFKYAFLFSNDYMITNYLLYNENNNIEYMKDVYLGRFNAIKETLGLNVQKETITW